MLSDFLGLQGVEQQAIRVINVVIPFGALIKPPLGVGTVILHGSRAVQHFAFFAASCQASNGSFDQDGRGVRPEPLVKTLSVDLENGSYETTPPLTKVAAW